LHNGARSVIDHILVSENLRGAVVDYSPVENIDNMSDHLVIVGKFNIPSEYFSTNTVRNDNKPNWYKATVHDIDEYKSSLRYELSKIVLPDTALACKDLKCDVHYHDIECLHDNIVNACLRAGKVLPSTGVSVNQSKSSPLPGWKDHYACGIGDGRLQVVLGPVC
jgi:hypothetical protein